MWKARGYSGVYNAGNHFNANNGRFNVVKDGYFLCSTQVRARVRVRARIRVRVRVRITV